MNYTKTLLFDILEEAVPKNEEYEFNAKIRDLLREDIRQAMGPEMVEKVDSAYGEHLMMECERYFRHGVRLVLELLRL